MEVEYEGDPAFLKDGLESLLIKMAELSTKVPSEPEILPDVTSSIKSPSTKNGYDFSTSTIAGNLGGGSTTDLAVCALAKLELVDGKSGVKKADISKEMKTASAYYKKSMSSNLGQSLTSLIKNNRVNHGASDTYSLNADERKSIEAKFANIG